MAKPSNLFRWSTDASTTTEPSEGQKDTGFTASDKPPAKWLNWLWNGAYQWFSYLDNLHNETQFLNKEYVWTNNHEVGGNLTVGGYVDVTGVVTSDSNIIAEGYIQAVGEVVAGNNCSVTGNVTATGSATIGTDVIAKNGDVRAGGDFEYCDTSTGTATTKGRTVLVPLVAQSTTWSHSPAPGANSYTINLPTPAEQSATIDLTAHVPSGATLTRVRLAMRQGAASVDPAKVLMAKVWKHVINTDSPPTSGTSTQLGSTASCSTPGTWERLPIVTNELIDKSTTYYYVQVTGSDNGASSDSVRWVEIQFNDPGPRNH